MPNESKKLAPGTVVVQRGSENFLFSIYASDASKGILLDAAFSKSLIEVLSGQSELDESLVAELGQILDGQFYISDSVNRIKEREREATRLVAKWQALQDAKRGVNNVDFHTSGIVDALDNFDSKETTVSYAYKDAHPTFSGVGYAERFIEKIVESKFPINSDTRILEVGGGTGLFAKGLLGYLHGLEISPSYTILDLSPELQRSQKQQLSPFAVEFVAGDATSEISPGIFDLVICNEVIADFPLSFEESQGIVYSGVNNFLYNLYRWLAPDGRAIVTEYFSDAPMAVRLHGHNEYSIDFSKVADYCATLPFIYEVENLGVWLGALGDTEVLDDVSSDLFARYICPSIIGRRLDRRVFPVSEVSFHLGSSLNVVGLTTATVSQYRKCLSPFGFNALLLKKR